MVDVLLFHHAHGQTAGFLDFAEQLESAGHVVHTPDLYEGQLFADLDEGVAYAEEVGFEEIIARGVAAAEELPTDVVYAGFSLGSLPAQALAQTRPGARGAVLYHGGVLPSEFGRPWPQGVPLQVHVTEQDPWNDLDAVKALADQVMDAELCVYPGCGHLFADPHSADYDPELARQLTARTLDFLRRGLSSG